MLNRLFHGDEAGPLAGRRVAVLATDGFELVELVVPVGTMRLAGATVDVVSIHPGHIRGMNLHEPASRVAVDLTLDEADPDAYDGLLIPGGFVNPDLLRQSAAARAFVRAFDAAGKPIASLCHGPWVLASAGLLEGRRVTSWPGLRDDLVNAGAVWVDEPLVNDGTLVTSRGPQDLKPFCTAILRLFAGRDLGPEFPRSAATASAPQPRDPPRIVVDVMRWLPRPSVRTLLGVAAVAAGVALYRRSHGTPSARRSAGHGRSHLSRLFGDPVRSFGSDRNTERSWSW
ncbi:MAG TPA: type 1 glutamine amidotransferase domain-containing protein [Humisphaera sp.]